MPNLFTAGYKQILIPFAGFLLFLLLLCVVVRELYITVYVMPRLKLDKATMLHIVGGVFINDPLSTVFCGPLV